MQNSAWMFASSGVSILIQFVFFTILARIYSPAVYGVYGIFNLYVSTLGNASTFGYHQAFVIPKEERKFSALLRLSIWISVVFSIAVTIMSFCFGKSILSAFEHDELGNWIYWIGPAILLMSFDRITSDWAVRNKEFRKQTWWSTSTTLLAKVFNALYGWLISATAAGLVYTTLFQHGMRTITYCGSVLHDFKVQMKLRFTRAELYAVGREYKEFPLYIYWGNVINIFSNNLPAALLIKLGYSVDAIGFYSYSLIILDLPIRMLGAGVYSVFAQKASELVHGRMHELAGITWKLYRGIVLISLLFSVFIFAFGEKFYLLLLEERWSTAGRAAEVLIIFYFFRMISSPLSSLFNILRKERQFFIFQLVLTVVRVLGLVIGSWYTTDFVTLMLIYSLVNAIMYFAFCIWIFKLINFSIWKVTSFTLFTSIAGFGLGYVIRMFLL